MRTEIAGGIFHVTTRGNARAVIFHDDRDYEVFLKRLASTVADFNWALHAYCVMPNHFHLLVETPDANLSKGMLVLNGSYARRYNARYDRVGHVFQTPYRSLLVESEPHFMESMRYIANNPVRGRLCRWPEQWRWSSYRATCGLDVVPPFLRLDRALELFGSGEEFRNFVLARATDMSSNHVAGHV